MTKLTTTLVVRRAACTFGSLMTHDHHNPASIISRFVISFIQYFEQNCILIPRSNTTILFCKFFVYLTRLNFLTDLFYFWLTTTSKVRNSFSVKIVFEIDGPNYHFPSMKHNLPNRSGRKLSLT